MRLRSGFVILTIMSMKRETYYKRMDFDGKMGCVEANVFGSVARKFGGQKGSCADIECNIYKGEKTVPLVGSVTGYYCDNI